MWKGPTNRFVDCYGDISQEIAFCIKKMNRKDAVARIRLTKSYIMDSAIGLGLIQVDQDAGLR